MVRCKLSRIILPVCIALLVCCEALSDTIHLKNGRKIEGVITSQNDEEVVLEFGVGSVRIKTSRIERVERDDGGSNQQVKERWEKEYFLSRRYVPAGMKELASRFESILESRDNAISAHKQSKELDGRIKSLKKRKERLKDELKKQSGLLGGASPKRDISRYNELVRKCNSINAKITSASLEIEKVEATFRGGSDRITSYISRLIDFSAHFKKQREEWENREMTARHEYFLDQLGKKTESYLGEFNRSEVRTEIKNGSVFVKVVVNDRATGKLLIDTGASIVLLTSDFARRAGVDHENAPEVDIILANGKTAQADQITLGSVQVGEAGAENVAGVVIDANMSNDADGLLGMSFLKNFVVQFEGAGGKLKLIDFEP